MKQAIAKFSAAARGAPLATFYFAGHGAQWGESSYIVPADADLVVIGKNAKLVAESNPEVAAAFEKRPGAGGEREVDGGAGAGADADPGLQ